eukprot:gene32638-39460_t
MLLAATILTFRLFVWLALQSAGVGTEIVAQTQPHSANNSVTSYIHPLNPNVSWDCNRPWPNHAMYMTLNIPPRSDKVSRHNWPTNLLPEYYEVFFRGVMMFYPWQVAKTTLVIMVDAEMKNSTELREDVLDVLERGQREFGAAFPTTCVIFNDPIPNVYSTGYSRMQYLGFYADKYLAEEFILFVDSDAFFHSYMDREDLWENGKAIIQARFYRGNYHPFRLKTFEALGQQEFLSCMSYFPFIIRRADLPHIREAIRKRIGRRTFEEAYAAFAREFPGAQYNIMCQWLYFNRRDEYAWRIKDLSPDWDGVDPDAPKGGGMGNRSTIRPGDIAFTVPYLSDHCTYGLAPIDASGALIPGFQDFKHTWRVVEHLLLTSLCYLETKPPYEFKVARNATKLSQWALSKYESFCPSFLQKHPYHDAWLRFENNNFEPIMSQQDKMRLKAARESRVKNCKHTYLFI